MGVAVGRLHLEHAFGELEHRDVVGAAAQVVDRHLLFLLLVQPVRQRRGGRLVDDAHDVEADDVAGVANGLPLPVVEVGGNGHHRLVDLLLEILLRDVAHLLPRLPQLADVMRQR